MSVSGSANAQVFDFEQAAEDQGIALGKLRKLHSPEEADLLHMIYDALMQAAPGQGSEVGTPA